MKKKLAIGGVIVATGVASLLMTSRVITPPSTVTITVMCPDDGREIKQTIQSSRDLKTWTNSLQFISVGATNAVFKFPKQYAYEFFRCVSTVNIP